jgi:hypothetical protein
MAQAHEFKVGDNVTVTDHHTTVGTYQTLCFVEAIEGDVYIMRKRSFKVIRFRVGKYYPHMTKEN